jgi:hypothetical protein
MVLKNNLKYQVNLILILVLPLQKVIICLLMLHYWSGTKWD